MDTVKFSFRDFVYRCNKPGDMAGEYVSVRDVLKMIEDSRQLPPQKVLEELIGALTKSE